MQDNGNKTADLFNTTGTFGWTEFSAVIPDVQDRLRHAFPKLLEIRRETQRRAKPEAGGGRPGDLDPLELCCAFLGGADGEEQKLLADVIRTVQEVM